MDMHSVVSPRITIDSNQPRPNLVSCPSKSKLLGVPSKSEDQNNDPVETTKQLKKQSSEKKRSNRKMVRFAKDLNKVFQYTDPQRDDDEKLACWYNATEKFRIRVETVQMVQQNIQYSATLETLLNACVTEEKIRSAATERLVLAASPCRGMEGMICYPMYENRLRHKHGVLQAFQKLKDKPVAERTRILAYFSQMLSRKGRNMAAVLGRDDATAAKVAEIEI